MTPQEINEKRLGLVAKQREMNDKAGKEGRDFNADEQQHYDAMDAEFESLDAQLKRANALDAREKQLATPVRAGLRPELVANNATKRAPRPNDGEQYFENFNALLREGEARVSTGVKASLVKGTGTSGGYLAPTIYEEKIIEKAYPITLMRQFASVDTSSSDSSIVMEGSLPTAGWIDELGTYPETDLSFGNGGFSAWKMGFVLRASEEILQDSFLDLPSYIAKKSATSIAQTEDAAFFQGDGNKKPRGVALDATLGLTTASATTFTSDELLDFMDALPTAYEPRAVLIATKAWRAKLRKMKDTTGQYLWQPGLQSGAPDVVNGRELKLTPYLGALTAGQTIAIYGDLSFYQILDRLGFYMQQLNELYALNGQVGFRCHKRLDGKLLQTAAVVKMNTAAS